MYDMVHEINLYNLSRDLRYHLDVIILYDEQMKWLDVQGHIGAKVKAIYINRLCASTCNTSILHKS